MRWLRRRQTPLPGEPLGKEAFHEPIGDAVAAELTPLDFSSPRQGLWIDGGSPTLRRVLELRHYKGAVSAFRWGFALSYTPHFDSSFSRLSWHRTVKTARADVFPLEEPGEALCLERLSSPEDHARRVPGVVARTLENAFAYWEKLANPEALLKNLAELEADQDAAIGYWSYPSLPLAHSFTLQACGHGEEARERIHEFARRFPLTPAAVDALLVRLEATARLA